MNQLAEITLDDLRGYLDVVQEKETTERLMVAIGYKQGLDGSTIANWYGWSEQTVNRWIEEFKSKPIEQVIDESERDSHTRGSRSSPSVQATVEYLNYAVIDEYEWELNDDDLFETAREAALDPEDFGRIMVNADESILAAAENRGFEWPYSCRGGACSNCAVVLKEGEITMPPNTILSEQLIEERDARLTCVGVPANEDIKLVYNAKHIPELAELRLPSR